MRSLRISVPTLFSIQGHPARHPSAIKHLLISFRERFVNRRWTDSIAVGSRQFTERIKNAMGAMAKVRSVQPTEGAFELQETKSAYNAVFDPENRDIDPQYG
jgi:hypothetical protein